MDDSAKNEEQLFEAARRLEDPAERLAFLESACFGAPDLQHRIEVLLAAGSQADQFFAEGVSALNESIRALPLTEKPGDRIGHYKLLQKIGEGGCGIVYMAEQEEPVRRRVALKVIKLGMDTKNVVGRFEAERQALAMMDHPNIAKVFDAGATVTGRPFFVMELVRGVKITEFCDEKHLPTRDRLELFIQICHAVQHAHQKGIIHRDLKPSNILVTSNDGVPTPKVIDFGIAKAIAGPLTDQTLLTAFEQLLGTPAYMSPEQMVMTSIDVDTRSDIYSLGVLLYELLTGKTPFDTAQLLTAGIDELRRTIREEEPLRPSTRLKEMAGAELTRAARQRQSDPPKLINVVRRDLDWIAMKCLEKDRGRRYHTVNALAMDLKRYLENQPIVARPPTKTYRFRKFLVRHTVGVLMGVSLVLLLVLGSTVSLWEALRARRAESEQMRHRAAAEKARRTAEELLQKVELENAEMLFTASDSSGGLAALARLVRENPSNATAGSRLISALTQRSFFLPTDLSFKHDGEIKSIQFSPDGERIVTSSLDRTARIWEFRSGRLLMELKLEGSGSWASYNADGSRLVTGTVQGAVQLWDASTGAPLMQNWRFPNEVFRAEFSPDGAQLAVAAGEVRVLSLNSNAPPDRQLPQEGEARWVCFSPDGKKIITANFGGIAQFWDAATGAPIGLPFKNDGRLWTAEISPDGERLVTAGNWVARMCEIRSRRLLFETPKHLTEVYWAQFTSDGSRILIRSFDHTLRMLDGFTGAAIGEPALFAEHPFPVLLAPDGRRVIRTLNGEARVWTAPFPGPGAMIFPAGEGIWNVRFSPNGELIAGSSRDRVRIWDTRSGKALGRPLEYPHAQNICLDFSPDSQWIAAGGWNEQARIWNAKTGAPRTPWLRHKASVHTVRFAPDGRVLLTASYENEGAHVWDAETGRLLNTFVHANQITSARFDHAGARIITSSTDNTAQIWDVKTGERLLSPFRHAGTVWYAEFSPDDEWIATASEDKTVQIHSARTGKLRFPPLQHTEPMVRLQFSSDGRFVATMSFARAIRVFDSATGHLVSESLQHSADVLWSDLTRGENPLLLSVCRDEFVRVWDPFRAQLAAEKFSFGGLIGLAEFSPVASWIAAACEDGAVRLWELPQAPLPIPSWLPELAEGIAGERFLAGGGLTYVPPEELLSLRRRLLKDGAGDSQNWVNWFFTEPEKRSATPSSSQGLGEYVQFLRRQNTVASLRQALPLAPNDPLVLAQLAHLIVTQDAAENPRKNGEAEWLTRRAASLPSAGPGALMNHAIESRPRDADF